MKSYWMNRKQRVRTNNNLSEYKGIATGLFQGSILGSLQFNINWIYFSFQTPSWLTMRITIHLIVLEIILKKLRIVHATILLQQVIDFAKITWCWIQESVTSSVLGTELKIKLFYLTIMLWNSSELKLIGLIINNRLSFKSHIYQLCKEAPP